MLRRPPLHAAALVAVSIALPLTAAQAAIPSISVWSGKTKQHKLSLQLTQNAPGKAVYVALSVSCKDASGTEQGAVLQVHKLPSNGRLKITDMGAPASIGTLTLSASVVAKRKAVGTVSYKLMAANGSCTGKDTFSLKYAVGHGG